ncbi:putative dna double-strand break repair rad50 ATPase [Schistosoma mansoni]|uniref:putative dna double-strand break repair rad50 ATPase n=1 Tax=Schistosoma mansoni TaxID=6183 RepID=UPI00022DCC9A|nr:putative dna double-strand break repair rad50 ATPase [Schistosoma mansoni]|eukprot:XP_018655615.1 putative dna double-strand break repair rad50 ATPase [Schistosoma mansoni]
MLNEKELKNLGDSLNSIKSTYEESQQALEQLTRILKLLRLNELKSNEENSVTLEALNNCLDNKANKQIFLNQKMEEIEMTELKVKETQKMLDDLNAEITEERRNAVRKVIKLEEETRKLGKALNVQNEKNKKLEIPHQEVNELLRNKRFEEFSLSNNVDKLHNNIHEYKIRKSALLNTIQKKEMEIKTAEEKRDFIQQSLNKMLEEHEESLENIRKELKKIEESQKTSITNIGAYEKKKEILKADEQRYESDKDKLQKVFKKKETEVIQVEKEYMMKAEKTAELQDQINEMLEKMDNLNVSNKSIIDNLKQQAEMINGQLANARKERVQLQRKQRKIHKQVNSFNDEQNLFIPLNKLLDEFDEKCQQMDKNIQNDLSKLEGLNNKVKKIEMIETETKSFQVEMNQNIRSLENEIKRLNDENKKLDFDLKLSKKQTNTFEIDYMKRLMNQIDSLNMNEKNIYTYGCRLKTVEIENSRINTGITKQEQSIQTICSDWEKILRFKSIFNNQYQSITGSIN